LVIAVGEQKNLTHRNAAVQNLTLRDLERVLEVSSATRLQALDTIFQLGAIFAERFQMTEDVGLRIECDHAGEIGVVELTHSRRSRAF